MAERTAVDADPSATKSRRWFGARPDRRLQQAIGELELRLRAAGPAEGDRGAAISRGLELLARAKGELARRSARNEPAWAWFHAARREELRLRSPRDLTLLEIDLAREAGEKLESWRRKAVEDYGRDHDSLVERVVRMQRHLDETAENHNRKRVLQRAQLLTYLGLLVTVTIVICLLELFDRGLVGGDVTDTVDGWWVVAGALYGTLGGAFSSAQRVASAGTTGRYPDHRRARLANAFRPLAGGAGGLIALAALQADLLGDAGRSGPRVAVVTFVAGFSERFISSLAAGQEG